MLSPSSKEEYIMGLQVYLNFKGNSREAIKFYSEVFNVDNANIFTFGEAAAN